MVRFIDSSLGFCASADAGIATNAAAPENYRQGRPCWSPPRNDSITTPGESQEASVQGCSYAVHPGEPTPPYGC